jgi:hypothetical protein
MVGSDGHGVVTVSEDIKGSSGAGQRAAGVPTSQVCVLSNIDYPWQT